MQGAPRAVNPNLGIFLLTARTHAVRSNILIVDIAGTGMTSAEFSGKLAEHQVRANGVNPETMRFVTHLDVSRSQCERALRVIEQICAVRASA